MPDTSVRSTLPTMADDVAPSSSSPGGSASASASASSSSASSSSAPPPTVGRFVYPDGAVYEGGFVVVGGQRVKQGAGSYSDAHASYEGQWAGDRMHGKGFYTGASGATYSGQFEDNKFSGLGTYKWADGAEYRGAWSHSKMHGAGSYTAADGLQFVGSFYNGLYVSGTTHVAIR